LLPADSFCAACVRRSSFEPRPGNTTANQLVPTSDQLQTYDANEAWTNASALAVMLQQRVTGNITGTTDEIIQWSACKWGIDEDVVRAQAVVESYWRESATGDWTTTVADCPPGTYDGSGCYQSYGLFQMKYKYFGYSVWPLSRDSTPFNADASRAWLRTCYEGGVSWLGNGYAAGDLWGCLGNYYSGGWWDSGAANYVNEVQSALAQRTWSLNGF
jgi:hypothetical protein